MDKKNRNVWDFMSEHPVISFLLVSAALDTAVRLIRPSRASITFSKPDLSDLKSCGSTEEETETTEDTTKEEK